MSQGPDTAEIAAARPRHRALMPPPAQPARRWWSGLTGMLAAGLAVLALLVLGVQVLGWVNAMPGPGPAMVIGHIAVATAAVGAQHVADRNLERGRSRPAMAASAGVVLLTAGALLLFWWA